MRGGEAVVEAMAEAEEMARLEKAKAEQEIAKLKEEIARLKQQV